MSGLDLWQRGTSNREDRLRVVARSSQKSGPVRRSIQLGLALTTMTAASCLITTDPNFEPPARTAPFFEPDSAVPPNGQVFTFKAGREETFSALVQSEDSGSPLLARLYLDYGTGTKDEEGATDQVYVDLVASVDTLTPGTWDETGRKASVRWRESYFVMDEGCHRFTLMVVHDGFDPIGCPLEAGDYATMTWLVQKCESGDCEFNPEDCPPIAKESVCPPRQGTPANVGGSP